MSCTSPSQLYLLLHTSIGHREMKEWPKQFLEQDEHKLFGGYYVWLKRNVRCDTHQSRGHRCPRVRYSCKAHRVRTDLRLPVRDETLVRRIRRTDPRIRPDMYTFRSNLLVVRLPLRGPIEVRHHPEIRPLSRTETEHASIEICGLHCNENWDSGLLGYDAVQFHRR
jgi:hypothetical protein